MIKPDISYIVTWARSVIGVHGENRFDNEDVLSQSDSPNSSLICGGTPYRDIAMIRQYEGRRKK